MTNPEQTTPDTAATDATPVSTPPSTTSPIPATRGERLQRWLKRPSTITLAGAGCIALAIAVSAIPYGPGSILADYDLQAAILAITAVSLFVTAQFAREATNESRSQFEQQQKEHESRRKEARGRLSLMLAVECAQINEVGAEAYRTLKAQPVAAPWPAWSLPRSVFDTLTAQIVDLDQATSIIDVYAGAENAVKQGRLLANMKIEFDRAPTVTDEEKSLYQVQRDTFLLVVGLVLDMTAALLPLLVENATRAKLQTNLDLTAKSQADVDAE